MEVKIIPVTAFEQNCSLLICPTSGHAAVVDPGGDLDRILAAITEAKVEVKKIFITHGHLDHAGGTAELAEKLGVPIEGPHIEDSFWIDQMDAQCEMFGMSGAVFKPDRWLNEGDSIEFGDQQLRVVHCPGHTPGHVVFVNETARIATVGDVLFQGSVGRTDFPRGDFEQLKHSIREKLFPLGDDIRFVPGHGPTSTFGHERETNPLVGDSAVT